MTSAPGTPTSASSTSNTRLGLAREADLLRAYEEVAYLDAPTLLGAASLGAATASLGISLVRLRPRAVIDVVRGATARLDADLHRRGAAARARIGRRFAELSAQGHGPRLHEGNVTFLGLRRRVLEGIDPMTGTRVDGEKGGQHFAPPVATRIRAASDFVAAESVIRRSAAFETAFRATSEARRRRFIVRIPIGDALGPDYEVKVEGVRRIGVFGETNRTAPMDFSSGAIMALFELVDGGEPRLFTMDPDAAEG